MEGCRRSLVLSTVAAVAAVSVVAGGCGDGRSPGVARVASARTDVQSGALAVSRCMRSHGVPSFPDPPRIGSRALKPSPQRLGVSDSQFQAAVSACDHLTASKSVPSTEGSTPATATGNCVAVATCYRPRQLEATYGILPLLEHGIDGRGETVVLPELAEPQFPLPASDIRRDLARFDQLFHLPAARVRVVSTLAPSASPWLANGEEVLDTEMVHAIAPRAAIVEVLIKGTSLENIPNAVAASVSALRLGTSLGAVISISAAGQTGGEHCDTRAEVATLHEALRKAANHHVTVVAASGDIGAVGEPCQLFKGLTGGTFAPVREANLPASDPLVLSAGGTTLTAGHTNGAYINESAWGLPCGEPGSHFQASGGGLSHVHGRPSYQDHLPGIGVGRGVPDVAADACPDTGFPVVTADGGGRYTISGHGGTSASAPLWAGIVALADQHAGRHLGFVNAALYRIGRSRLYRKAFHDVTAGNNSVRFPPKTISGYRAASGWDPVTGWGTPNARVLIPLLARDVRLHDGNGL
ncbi:MAG TPA: S53 family peptidase [Gaiellaceae bacterium]